MKKVLLVLSLIALVGAMAWAQLEVTLKSKTILMYQKYGNSGTGQQFLRVAIPPAAACSSQFLYIGDTGGLLHLADSSKINSGGRVTIGLRIADRASWANAQLKTGGDSTAIRNGSTTAGIGNYTYNLPFYGYVAFVVSNSGSDTVWESLTKCEIGRN